MTQAMESLVREACAPFRRGDLDGYLGMCTGDFVFKIPGETLWQECTQIKMAFTSWHDGQWKASTRVSSGKRYHVMSEQTQLTEQPPVAVTMIGFGPAESASAREICTATAFARATAQAAVSHAHRLVIGHGRTRPLVVVIR